MRYPRLRTHWEIKPTLTVESNRQRLANSYHLLREVVHLHLGWLPRTNSIDVKILLGIHVYEDAVFLTVALKRMRFLGWGPGDIGEPNPHLASVISYLHSLETWEEYIAAVYNVIKPALIDAWENHFTEADPVLDEPTRRILSDFLRITAQHISGGMALIESLLGVRGPVAKRVHQSTSGLRDLWLGGEKNPLVVPPAAGTPPLPRPMQPIALPAREAFCYTARDNDLPALEAGVPASDETIRALLHAQLNRELVSAEICALLSHENPSFPLDFHRDMARRVWDEMRHAQALENLLERAGDTNWGEFPINLDSFTEIRALPAAEQLLRLDQITSEREFAKLRPHARIESGGRDVFPQVVEYFLADERSHTAIARKWADWLASGGADEPRRH